MAKRVLLQTVGMADTGFEALAKVVVDTRPDLVVHVASAESAAKALPKLEEWFKQRSLRMPKSEFLLLEEFEDLTRIVNLLRTKIDELRRAHGAIELEVDFTAGTKVMSAAVVWAAISARAKAFHYASGTRNERGSVLETQRVVTLGGADATAPAALDDASGLFVHRRYEAASELAGEVADRLPEDSLDRARATSLAAIARAYALWDLFEWEKVEGELKSALGARNRPSLERAGWRCEGLERQKAHARSCHRVPWGPQRTVDLLENAKRCMAGERWDDAQARLYRLAELLCQVATERALGPVGQGKNPTKARSLEGIEAIAPRLAARLRDRGGATATRDLGLREAAALVVEARPATRFAAFLAEHGLNQVPRKGDWSDSKSLGGLLNRRNESWLAHGASPAKPDDVRELARMLEDAVRIALVEHHDSTDVDIDRLFGSAAFLPCPWHQCDPPALRLGGG